MTNSLNSIGSIATFIAETMQVPLGVSGNLIIIADVARQHVENYTGNIIGSNSIESQYQPAILDFARADTIDMINAQSGGEKVRLAELSVEETGEEVSAEQYRILGELKLKPLGRKVSFARSY